MTLDELRTTSLVANAAIMVVAIGAYYKYGDRADVVDQTTPNADRVLGRSLSAMSKRLEGVVLGAYESRIVDMSGGHAYSERVGNPVGSEKLREVLEDFVLEHAKDILDYRDVFQWRSRIYHWSRKLSWTLLGLIVWQALSSAMQLGVQLAGYDLERWSLATLFLVTCSVVLFCFICIVSISYYRDKVIDKSELYETF